MIAPAPPTIIIVIAIARPLDDLPRPAPPVCGLAFKVEPSLGDAPPASVYAVWVTTSPACALASATVVGGVGVPSEIGAGTASVGAETETGSDDDTGASTSSCGESVGSLRI